MPLRARRFADPPRLIALPVLLAAIVVVAVTVSHAGAASKPKVNAPAPVPVPQGFLGVDVDGPMFGPDTPIDLASQLKTMVGSGVQSIRVAFSWAAGQPYESDADVPDAQNANFTDIAARPTTFQVTDMVVRD